MSFENLEFWFALSTFEPFELLWMDRHYEQHAAAAAREPNSLQFYFNSFISVRPSWSSLVEGDKQQDWPNSQACMEWYHLSTAYFVSICHKHNSLPLGPIQPSSHSTKELHVHSSVYWLHIPCTDAFLFGCKLSKFRSFSTSSMLMLLLNFFVM